MKCSKFEIRLFPALKLLSSNKYPIIKWHISKLSTEERKQKCYKQLTNCLEDCILEHSCK